MAASIINLLSGGKRSVSGLGRYMSHRALIKYLDRVPVGIHILSPEGIIKGVNATEARLLGYKKSEMIGRSFLDFIPEPQRGEAWERFQQKLRGKKVEKVVDRTYLTKDGKNIFVTSEDQILRSKGRKAAGVITALIDITELMQLRDQIEKLRRMQDILGLAAGFSHEFNNILACIQGAAILLGGAVPLNSEQGAEMLGVIRTECQRGVDLNRRIQFAARNGAVPNSIFRLDREVAEAVKIFEATLLGQRPIEVEKELQEIEMLGNPGEIHSVILNLLLNARNAIGGPGKIRIRLQEVSLSEAVVAQAGIKLEKGEYIEIMVADNGRGIPGEIRDKIFDPFFSTGNPAENSGLGLPVVWGVVNRHGGGILLESPPALPAGRHGGEAGEEGKGTAFRLLFPIKK
jgi:PAS domain S-box-containing protein